MANLPSTLPAVSSIGINVIKRQHKKESESGYPLTRALGTAKKHEIKIGWKRLTSTQLDTLETWFDENMGVVFTYTNPESAATYSVVLWEDMVQTSWVPPRFWSASITMREL